MYFNAKLIDAIAINVKGTMRMFDLSSKCKQLENFVHISTSYVNSDKLGFIEEEIYPSNEDAEKMIDGLDKLDPDQLLQ